MENWGHPTESRPLTDRLLVVPEYRQRLDFYLRELVEGAFQPDSLFPEIDRFASLMLQAARDDVYRSYDWGFSPESSLRPSAWRACCLRTKTLHTNSFRTHQNSKYRNTNTPRYSAKSGVRCNRYKAIV